MGMKVNEENLRDISSKQEVHVEQKGRLQANCQGRLLCKRCPTSLLVSGNISTAKDSAYDNALRVKAHTGNAT